MNSRFGMTYVAIHAAQARARAAELQQRQGASEARTAIHVPAQGDDEGAVRRMAAILAVFVVVAGLVVWLTA